MNRSCEECALQQRREQFRKKLFGHSLEIIRERQRNNNLRKCRS
jgi:hypothetical protein